MSRIHLIVHGHFYQPPRGNPWTGDIEVQPSAAPYHDWNERITAECYAANARSRIQDGRGRLLEVVNNYHHISFDFGPTLFDYLLAHDPDTCRRIVAADEDSRRRLGHGNALAQAYNHMIMPLATARDRWTQIRWGQEHFRAHFGREPEGMWLPETAVNRDTLDDLARAGMRFVILAPSQAEAWRPAGGEWRPGPPPSDRTYFCPTAHGDLAVLFYHAGLSAGVAFEHLLRNSGILADRIEAAARESDLEGDRLVMICSDGESYGHHEKLADMCLAHLARREAPARGLVLTNPAAYLAEHPPGHEVRLKPGRDGQGTSWSCAHGVDRWQLDCGCADGGQPGWNQAWRRPLRQAFDALRREIDPLYEREARDLLRDPWAARDDYIRVLLGRPLGAVASFLEQHLLEPRTDERRALAFRLLEMQRHAMFMYTSCGWFFADLAGLEAVQNLRYAHRAAELARLVAGRPLDERMRHWLGRARSNLPREGSGTDILRRRVEAESLPPEKAAAVAALELLLGGEVGRVRLGRYRLQVHRRGQDDASGYRCCTCRLTVEAERTREGGLFDVVTLAGQSADLVALVRAARPSQVLPAPDEVLAALESRGLAGLAERLAGDFPRLFSLAELPFATRNRLLEYLLQPLSRKVDDGCERLLVDHGPLFEGLAGIGVRLPRPLLLALQGAGEREFGRLLERDLESGDLSAARKLYRLLSELGVELDGTGLAHLAGNHLRRMLEQLLEHPGAAAAERLAGLLERLDELDIDPDSHRLQVLLGERLEGLVQGLLDPGRPGGPDRAGARALLDLAERLRIATDTRP